MKPGEVFELAHSVLVSAVEDPPWSKAAAWASQNLRPTPKPSLWLADRLAGHFLELGHQRPVREWAVADPRDARRGPLALGRSAWKRNDIERQRHLAHHPLDLPGVGQARD